MPVSLFAFAKDFFHTKPKTHSNTKKANRWVRPSLLPLEDRLVLDTGFAGNSFPLDNTQPNLTLNYLIAVNGLFPSLGDSYSSSTGYNEPVLGSVSLFAGNFAPSGYALAQGQLLPVSQYSALYSILGNNFGGDGYNTFALPDLRGATAIGAGQGSGLSQRYVGDLSGMPTTTLLYIDLPNHDHQLLNPATNPPTVTGNTGTIGSSLPINNLMPTVAFNFQVVSSGTNLSHYGEIDLFCGPFMTNKAQGQLLPISENNTLFSKLGTTFGGTGGTFALPDMQGRVAVGAGSGLGLSPYYLGQTGGTETVTLTTNNLATHSHLQLDTNTPTGLIGGSAPFNNIQPFNTLTYAICTSGLYPTNGSQYGVEPFLGQIKMFASNTLPSGWTPCDGRVLSINANEALFSVVYNTYGGDGISTFALPDLRGRVPVGAGLPVGGGTYTLGQNGGSEYSFMTVNSMGTHSHTTQPIVSLTATTSVAYEPVGSSVNTTRQMVQTASSTSGNQLRYTITRDNTLGAGTVRLDFSGTGNASDYSLAVSAGATLTQVDADTIEIAFPANALEVILTASVRQDGSGEPSEVLTFTLVDGADYNLHFSLQEASGTLLDMAPLIFGGGITGANSNGTQVRIFNQSSSSSDDSFTPFPGFQGEVRVTEADTNGDGIPEIIASAGPGGGPAVLIRNGATGRVLASFFAYDSNFTGGVYVAAQDMNNDGIVDIVTSAGAGGASHIKVFDGLDQRESGSFFAFDPAFTGGTSIACFDTDGDGNAEIVVGAGPGGGPHVKVFSGSTFALVKEFMAYDPGFTGGVFVAIGNIGVDGRVDIITGAGAGGGPHVKIWDYENLTVTQQFRTFPTAVNDQITDSVTQVLFRGGVRVGISDYDGDGINDVLAAAGPGGGPRVQVFSGLDFELLADFFTTDPDYRNGVFVS